MKRAIVAACGLLVVLVVFEAGAQTPTPKPPAPRPQRSTPSMPKRPQDLTITLVGCLRHWDAAMMDAPGSAPDPDPVRPGADHRYVVTDIEPSSSWRGTTAATGEPVDAERYIVTAIGGANLAVHLNRKVRIVGNVIDDATPPEAGTTSATPASRWPAIVAASVTSAGSTCKPSSS